MTTVTKKRKLVVEEKDGDWERYSVKNTNVSTDTLMDQFGACVVEAILKRLSLVQNEESKVVTEDPALWESEAKDVVKKLVPDVNERISRTMVAYLSEVLSHLITEWTKIDSKKMRREM